MIVSEVTVFMDFMRHLIYKCFHNDMEIIHRSIKKILEFHNFFYRKFKPFSFELNCEFLWFFITVGTRMTLRLVLVKWDNIMVTVGTRMTLRLVLVKWDNMVVTHENMCFVFSIYLPSFNFIIRGFCG
jgi:hypothetical protein